MNFLAHLYFADETTESRLGNIMADFVKGANATDGLDSRLVTGIQRHRAVDKYTDSHAVVKESKGFDNPRAATFRRDNRGCLL